MKKTPSTLAGEAALQTRRSECAVSEIILQ